jgi:DnaJ-class molecular chaperone
VRVDVDAHAVLPQGDDALVPVALHEAALGARIETHAAWGRAARAAVPIGPPVPPSRSGRPSPRTGVRGDLVAEVRIVLPAVIDERSKELLREFGRINNDDVRKDLAL